MFYTLAGAAKAVGKTRQAIQAAIKRGTISARKNELGQYEIDPAELHRVYPVASTSLPANESKTLTVADSELVKELRDRIDDLKQERDRWRNQAEELLHQVKALPPGQRRGFLAWLFRR